MSSHHVCMSTSEGDLLKFVRLPDDTRIWTRVDITIDDSTGQIMSLEHTKTHVWKSFTPMPPKTFGHSNDTSPSSTCDPDPTFETVIPNVRVPAC